MGRIKERDLGWIVLQYGTVVRHGWAVMFWPTLVLQRTANTRHKFALGLSWLNWVVGVVFWRNYEIENLD
jgi:hypothetical protein